MSNVVLLSQYRNRHSNTPDVARSYFNTAKDIDIDDNRLYEAARLYRLCLASNHDDTIRICALVNLGNVSYRLGDIDIAKNCYADALASDPSHVEANYNLGYLANNPMLALRYYRVAIASDPDFPDAHYNAALAYHKIGANDTAIEHMQRYLELGSDYATQALAYIKAWS